MSDSFLALLAFLAFLTFLFCIIGGFFILFWFRRNLSNTTALRLEGPSPSPMILAPPSDQHILRLLNDLRREKKLLDLIIVRDKIQTFEKELQRLINCEVKDEKAITFMNKQLSSLYEEMNEILKSFY